MELKNPIAVKFGTINGEIFGGPFKQHERTRRLFAINMAEEITNPADIRIPTQDFSVPGTTNMIFGIIAAIEAMKDGKDVYVGCMGGIGRTGLFIGCLAKVMRDWAVEENIPTQIGDPVAFTRQNYKKNAIETSAQMDFVRSFPTGEVLDAIRNMLFVPVAPSTPMAAFLLWIKLLRG